MTTQEKYSGEGYFLMMDVASLYPSLMIRYNLRNRNIVDPQTEAINRFTTAEISVNMINNSKKKG